MLVYEPPTSKNGPVPLARVENLSLARRVAQCAIAEADARAAELSQTDDFLGEMEREEADRLRNTLAFLIPGLQGRKQQNPAVIQ